MLTHPDKRAFTLIELLIVVAIIAILAAIAVPNFLEAQVRSKVSRAKADMRSIATAVESYNVDNNAYPLDGHAYSLWPPDLRSPAPDAEWLVYMLITTPVAYMTSAPTDPFPRKEDDIMDDLTPLFDYWGTEIYSEPGDRGEVWRAQGVRYLFHTTGPDSERNYVDPGNSASGIRIGLNPGNDSKLAASILPENVEQLEWAYDPTNGTKSAGEIARTNKGSVPD